jgi:hypothetical protein
MNYRLNEQPLKNRKQTSDEIKYLVRTYCNDLDIIKVPVHGALVPLSAFPFQRYYDFIRQLRYERDHEPVEQVGRPAWIMERRIDGMDCKKKAVMIASWLQIHGIPFRLVGTSRRGDREIHHIFPQAKFNGEWVNVDATYSNYRIGQIKHVTAKEIL